MSDPEHAPDDSATNRVYLCVFILLVALLGFGAVGLKPPHPRKAPRSGPLGSVVLKQGGQVFEGVVLERGAVLKVLSKGSTRLIPLTQVERYQVQPNQPVKTVASSEHPAPAGH